MAVKVMVDTLEVYMMVGTGTSWQYDDDSEGPLEDDVGDIDWDKAVREFSESFNQLGLSDQDWSEWRQFSNILGLSPFEGFLSDVVYEIGEKKEVFQFCIQENNEEAKDEIERISLVIKKL